MNNIIKTILVDIKNNFLEIEIIKNSFLLSEINLLKNIKYSFL